MTISVIMTAYNVESYVMEAINSVIDQDGLSELIVIDDCSTDNTWFLIDSVKHDKIVKIRNSENIGLAESRNVGLDKVSSKWVTFLDADDFYLPGRLSALLKVATDQDLDMVADNVYNFRDGNFSERVEMHRNLSIEYNSLINVKEYLRQYTTTVPLIKVDFLNFNNLRFPRDRRRLEDFEFWTSCLLEGASFMWIKQPFYCYRGFRLGSLSQNLFVIADRELTSIEYLLSLSISEEAAKALYDRREYVLDKIAVMKFKNHIRKRHLLLALKEYRENGAVKKYVYNKLWKTVR